jgi:hypothetical protein
MKWNFPILRQLNRWGTVLCCTRLRAGISTTAIFEHSFFLYSTFNQICFIVVTLNMNCWMLVGPMPVKIFLSPLITLDFWIFWTSKWDDKKWWLVFHQSRFSILVVDVWMSVLHLLYSQYIFHKNSKFKLQLNYRGMPSRFIFLSFIWIVGHDSCSTELQFCAYCLPDWKY